MISNHPNSHIFGVWQQEHAGTMQVGGYANATVKDSAQNQSQNLCYEVPVLSTPPSPVSL